MTIKPLKTYSVTDLLEKALLACKNSSHYRIAELREALKERLRAVMYSRSKHFIYVELETHNSLELYSKWNENVDDKQIKFLMSDFKSYYKALTTYNNGQCSYNPLFSSPDDFFKFVKKLQKDLQKAISNIDKTFPYLS